jgi:hypothetical protein
LNGSLSTDSQILIIILLFIPNELLLMLIILLYNLLFNSNELLFRLFILKLNKNKQNKLHYKVISINNNSFSMKNKVDTTHDISQTFFYYEKDQKLCT